MWRSNVYHLLHIWCARTEVGIKSSASACLLPDFVQLPVAFFTRRLSLQLQLISGRSYIVTLWHGCFITKSICNTARVSKATLPKFTTKFRHRVVIHLPFSTGAQCLKHAIVLTYVSDSQVLTWQCASCMTMPIHNKVASLFMSHTLSQCLSKHINKKNVLIQGVTGGTDQTSGERSLGQTITKKPKTPISKVERFRR